MPSEMLLCEINDLHQTDCCQVLSQKLDGRQTENSIQFDNKWLKGELIRKIADKGLGIAKWKCLPHREIYIRKMAAEPGEEKKFILLYFLSPGSFGIRNGKKFRIKGSRNNVFLTNEVTVEFDLLPKQYFYLFQISFNASWLMDQLKNADHTVKRMVNEYIGANRQTILIEPFTLEEYKLLHELEVCMIIDRAEDFFIRSRVYNLVISYFAKVIKRNETPLIQTAVQYDQLIEAEMMVIENIKATPAIETIARKVNMSVPTLLRKFKLIHGKSIQQYYISKKMELARKIIIELGVPVKQIARILGYNQASAFIESFTKEYGYTPGQLKLSRRKFSFF